MPKLIKVNLILKFAYLKHVPKVRTACIMPIAHPTPKLLFKYTFPLLFKTLNFFIKLTTCLTLVTKKLEINFFFFKPQIK